MKEILKYCPECSVVDIKIELEIIEWNPKKGGIVYCPYCGKEIVYKKEDLAVKSNEGDTLKGA